MSSLINTRIKRHALPDRAELPPIITLDTLARLMSDGATVSTSATQEVQSSEKPDEKYWESIRNHFNINSGLNFLNNGTYSPPPASVLKEQAYWNHQSSSHPHQAEPLELIEQVRAHTAHFVNASIDEIALTRSTTEGINLLAQGLDWHEGDEIILDRHDHFTAFQSFLNLTGRHGVKLVFVDLGVEPGSADEIVAKYAAHITPRTKLLFINWVNYRTGWQMPIKALAELGNRHGLIISVDAAQAFGAVPIDIGALGIDHLAAPSHKWILAGPGAGFTYFNKRIIDKVWPISGPPNLTKGLSHWANTARKFDNHGPKNLAAIMGFKKALEFHDAIGAENFRGRLQELSRKLRQGLLEISWGHLITPLDPALSSALTTFHVGDYRSADDIAKKLLDQFNIKVNSEEFAHLNAIRISPHIFTSPAQIDYFISSLNTL